MKVAGRDWGLAALAAVLSLGLLFAPDRLPAGSRVAHAAGGTMHVLLFAGLAWLWGRIWPERVSRGWLWLVLVLVAAGVEGLQPRAGRSAELTDWLYGAGGAAILCVSWTRRAALRLRWISVFALALFPLGWEGGMWHREFHAFPVLARPGTWWAGRGWTLNAVRLDTTSEHRFRVRPIRAGRAGSAYPGLFRPAVRADWRRMMSLRTAIYWPGAEPAVVAIRVDDLPGNPPYAERFQREFPVAPGWNDVVIPAAEFRRASGGRQLNLEAICQWGVFLVSAPAWDYFLLDAVRLEPAQDSP